MSDRYFTRARAEIIPYLPARIERLLDVGCGAGTTVALIKSQHRVTWAGGVELVEAEAQKARAGICDRVWTVDVEKEPFERDIGQGSLDLILCLDVLEHLVDPWSLVKRLSPLLRPGGRLIVSVPNIRNWKFIKNLLFKGDFHYRDAGLLDRTHLRFFVRSTAEELTRSGGLQLISTQGAQIWTAGDARRWLSVASAGRLNDLMVKQWIVVGEKR